jgi:hypothetical protein
MSLMPMASPWQRRGDNRYALELGLMTLQLTYRSDTEWWADIRTSGPTTSLPTCTTQAAAAQTLLAAARDRLQADLLTVLLLLDDAVV